MFQSPIYWLVLFASAAVFWVLPRAVRFGFLGLVSFVYFYWLDVRAVDADSLLDYVKINSPVVLLVWTIAFYRLAPRVATMTRGGKRILLGLILGILAYLAFFKYLPDEFRSRIVTDLIAFFPMVAEHMFGSDSFLTRLALPLGISYFTFKLIHYIAEVAKGTIKDRSFQQFFCYIFLFPIFTAGPIERYDHFIANQSAGLRGDDVVQGLTRIIHGLIKKFVIAELLLLPLLTGLPGPAGIIEFLPILPWYKVVAFLCGNLLYAYLDFSAYSDLAIGSSRLFGIRILENFRWPLLAPNIGTFWQRWHMTLAGWCKAYVYLPLMGITRNPWLAVYATFLTMGLWHAGSLNWVAWGLYNATGVMAYLMFARLRRAGKIKLPEFGPLKYWGIPVTFAYMSGMAAFTVTHGAGLGVWSAIRILAKCAFIDLPPIGVPALD